MTVYSGLLFVHIAATLGLFAGFGLEWSAILQLRRTASVELARAWVGVFGPLGRLYGISLATILISGALLARIVGFWGAAWLYVAFGAMALLPALGPVVSRRRIGLLRRALDAERGSTSPTFRERARDPWLFMSLQLRTGAALAVVFLMTTKPELVTSLAVTAGAIALASLPSLRPRGRTISHLLAQ